jgi:MFS family permease
VLWPLAATSAIPAFFGLRRFPFIALAGYVLGVVCGELFGGFQVDVPPQFLHWGWLIWFCVFLASIALGIAIEVVRKLRATE